MAKAKFAETAKEARDCLNCIEISPLNQWRVFWIFQGDFEAMFQRFS